MAPLKPVTGSFSPVLPKGWSKFFIPLLNATPDSDLIAGFCGRFLSALNGNEEAFLMCARLVATLTAVPPQQFTANEKRHTAAIITLVKMLADRHDNALKQAGQ